MKNKNAEIREWINTAVQILMMLIMVFGLFQLIKIKIELIDITAGRVNAKEISTNKITFPNSNGSIESNGTALIIFGGTSQLEMG